MFPNSMVLGGPKGRDGLIFRGKVAFFFTTLGRILSLVTSDPIFS